MASEDKLDLLIGAVGKMAGDQKASLDMFSGFKAALDQNTAETRENTVELRLVKDQLHNVNGKVDNLSHIVTGNGKGGLVTEMAVLRTEAKADATGKASRNTLVQAVMVSLIAAASTMGAISMKACTEVKGAQEHKQGSVKPETSVTALK